MRRSCRNASPNCAHRSSSIVLAAPVPPSDWSDAWARTGQPTPLLQGPPQAPAETELGFQPAGLSHPQLGEPPSARATSAQSSPLNPCEAQGVVTTPGGRCTATFGEVAGYQSPLRLTGLPWSAFSDGERRDVWLAAPGWEQK